MPDDVTQLEFMESLLTVINMEERYKEVSFVFDNTEIITTVARLREIYAAGEDDKIIIHGLRMKSAKMFP